MKYPSEAFVDFKSTNYILRYNPDLFVDLKSTKAIILVADEFLIKGGGEFPHVPMAEIVQKLLRFDSNQI